MNFAAALAREVRNACSPKSQRDSVKTKSKAVAPKDEYSCVQKLKGAQSLLDAAPSLGQDNQALASILKNIKDFRDG